MNIYNDLLNYWFNENNKNWFGCTKEVDKFISTKYKKLLIDDYEYILLNKNIRNKYYEENTLSKIILFDQISRHIYREDRNEIKKMDEIALIILEKSNILDNIENFSPEERCFIIMPYRHTFQEEYLIKCIEYIQKWRKDDNNHSIYKRFYQATIKAYSKINNNKDLKYNIKFHFKNEIMHSKEDIVSVLDLLSIQEIKTEYKNIDKNNDLYKKFLLNIPNNYHGNLAVSVSGGVDSMVCLFLLKKLSLENTNIYPIAISINYKNRIEQDIEIYMVNQICNILGIDHFVREINEIQRTRDYDREFYEVITREIRFDCYAKMNSSIILGHNLDDSLENIFSNIKKRKNYQNLFGMTVNGYEKNINILRPLLHVSKNDIINFAKEYDIPYIYDSTPSWCERGKLRDILIPFLNQFDKNIISGIIDLTVNFNEIYKIYECSIPDIQYFNDYCIIKNTNHILFFDYWKRILNMITIKYQFMFIKNKSIKHMIDRLNENSDKRITLSKNIIMQKKEEYIYLFFDNNK